MLMEKDFPIRFRFFQGDVIMAALASSYVTSFTMECTSVTVEKDIFLEKMDIVVMVSFLIIYCNGRYD